MQGQAVTANVTIQVPDMPPSRKPDAPEVTRSATDPTTRLDVTWTAPDTPDGVPVTDHDVQYRESGEESWTDHGFTGTEISTTLTGLTKDTTCQLRVRAINAEGAGEWSSPGEGVTDTAGPTITGLRMYSDGGPYGTGAVISVRVSFSERIFVTGTPTLEVAVGANTRTFSYVPKSHINRQRNLQLHGADWGYRCRRHQHFGQLRGRADRSVHNGQGRQQRGGYARRVACAGRPYSEHRVRGCPGTRPAANKRSQAAVVSHRGLA
ncbi:MAG: fibronectin type III domain-containing protein [Chloroflexi bacterium]|nr:fibronectin type III domain-containing protein [Chloroflexota bacterium]